MNAIFNIQTAANRDNGVIVVNLLSFISLLIGGIISNGEHLHIGLKIWRYEIAFQLHNHKEDINQITTPKVEGE
ncbi:MAG: hypothetical protein HUU54_10215 [Ignavibacteriaceae bacterium]|nr:hypothetical protein [Ignavibacteriaceae bacterium]